LTIVGGAQLHAKPAAAEGQASHLASFDGLARKE
jgi:hypothetical protein